MIIVGSSALRFAGLEVSSSDILDLDFWVTESEDIKDVEYVLTESIKESRGIFDSVLDGTVIPDSIMDKVEYSICQETLLKYATPASILTIKMSHLGYDIKFQKTKRHILLLTGYGIQFIPELLEDLREHWKSVHGNKEFLNMNKGKDEFFTDFVDYKYDHDYLHELVAFPNVPVYSKCLKQDHEVLIDKDKFFNLSKDEQIKMFAEEISVIALERWIIPGTIKSWVKAWNYSLRKTITSLTKGWATDFIVDNLESFINPNIFYPESALKTLNLYNKEHIDTSTLKIVEFPGKIDDEYKSMVMEDPKTKKLYILEFNSCATRGWLLENVENSLREVSRVTKTIEVFE